MNIEPERGLVIRYDFLWKKEQQAGCADGIKDRPCAVVLVSKPKADNSQEVVVCPITHTPPHKGETAIHIPGKVARHLTLDDEPMWLKTNEVNTFRWEKGRLPYGVSPTPQGHWYYGFIPYAMRTQLIQQIRHNRDKRTLAVVQRNE